MSGRVAASAVGKALRAADFGREVGIALGVGAPVQSHLSAARMRSEMLRPGRPH